MYKLRVSYGPRDRIYEETFRIITKETKDKRKMDFELHLKIGEITREE